MCRSGTASMTYDGPSPQKCWDAFCSHRLANKPWLGCLRTQAELVQGCLLQGELLASNLIVQHKRHPYWSAMAKIIAALPGYALPRRGRIEGSRSLLSAWMAGTTADAPGSWAIAPGCRLPTA